jgi:hypothetical protein
MKVLSTSVTVLAAISFVVGASFAASACEWHMQATAAVTPAPTKEQTAAPATKVDPVVVAELGKAAIVPQPPKEDVLKSEAD